MSDWNTKYKVKVELLEKFFTRRSTREIRRDVEAAMESFVGTRSEYDAEFDYRMIMDEAVQTAASKEQQNKVKKVITEWQEELRAKYDMSPAMFSIVYELAYEDGHSAGYGEVESIFDDLADKFIKVYDIGFEAGSDHAR